LVIVMPYNGQGAGKTGHSDLVDNPEIREFIKGADYLRTPSDDEVRAIASEFRPAPSGGAELPALVLATDGSTYESAIDARYPSTRVGYIKISNIAVSVERYRALTQAPVLSRTVDPFEVNKLQRDADALTIALPSSNVRFGPHKRVKDAFRHRLLEVLDSPKTRLSHGTLIDTLFEMAVRTQDHGRIINGQKHVVVAKCPTCGQKPEDGKGIAVPQETRRAECPGSAAMPCGAEILASDGLRTHEGVTDYGSNQEALTRVMNAVEVLLLAHYLIELMATDRATLARCCFLVDGPLAVFGEPAWLSRSMQQLIFDSNEAIEGSHGRFLVIGLQKTGPLAEHATNIARHLPTNAIRVVDDEYRDRHIRQVDSQSNFGDDTYYGQDFIFRSGRSEAFVVGTPYPFRDKRKMGDTTFKVAKARAEAYRDLGRALDVIRTFECDLFASSIVPIIIAHRHASISRVPGGKVLDIASLAAFATGRPAAV
jgi:hypothetical protein